MNLKQINQVCNTFRAKYKGVLIQSGITRFVIIVLAIGLLSSVFDSIFHFGTFTRSIILISAVVGAGLMFWWTFVLSVKRTWSDKQILAYLDTTEESDKRGILELFELIKAENIQETNNDIGKGFINEAVNELNLRLNKISYGKAVKTSSLMRWVCVLAGIIGLIGLMGILDAEKTKIGAVRFINPFSLADWPSRTKITIFPPKDYTVTVKTKDNKTQEFKFDNVKEKSFEIICGSDLSNAVVIKDDLSEPKQFRFVVTRDGVSVEGLGKTNNANLQGKEIVGKIEYKTNSIITIGSAEIALTEKEKTPWSIPQLEAVKISALVSGVIPSQATLVYKSDAMNFEVIEKINVAKNGNIEYEFPSVKENISFYIKAGDYETRQQKISVIQRPYIKKIIADYKFPPYAGVPNKKVESGQLMGLEGTEVTLTFESSMELSKAVFNLEGVGRENLKQINPTTYTKTMLLEKNGVYNIELYEKSGFREGRPERFEIKVDPDAKPVIEILSPGTNLSETKNATINLSFRVADDFGIKSVGLYYKINANGEYKLLSTKVTGPIVVSGKKIEVKFDWDLRKMELPESSTIHYFIKAQDVNPTNNGITQSGEYEVELIKPSVFHQEAVLKAKVLLMEALIAWKNQYEAYKEGKIWSAKAENKINDAVWLDMIEKQKAAFRAVDAMSSYMSILTDKFERNHMQKEFMSARLNSINTDIQAMTSKELSVVHEQLELGKPKSDEDTGRIKSIRLTSQKNFEAHQKMSALYLERILRKLFDWRDLQDTCIKSTNIFERQTVVLEDTIKFAPKTIGEDPKDLSDELQTALTDLGKQQKSIYEAESSLEQMLVSLMDKAKGAKRHAILVPLNVAFKNLRGKRINDSLKKIDQLIVDNRCTMVIDDQKLVADVMKAVKVGLIKAGSEVEADQTLVGAIPVENYGLIIDPPIVPGDIVVDPLDDLNVSKKDDEIVKIIDDGKPKFPPILPGEDALTVAITTAIKFGDLVRAHAKYLASFDSTKIMLRFKKLKLNRMYELQAVTLEAINKAIEFAELDNKEFISKELKRIQGNIADSHKLIIAKDISSAHQAFIEDGNSHMSNLIQLIAREKEMKDIVEEHTRQMGKDSFGRLFLAQAEDHQILADSSIEIFKAYVSQSHINNTISRFINKPAESTEMKLMDNKERSSMVVLEGEVKNALDAEKIKSEKLTVLVKEKYKSYDNHKVYSVNIGKMAEDIKSGKADTQIASGGKSLSSDIGGFVANIKELMDERVKVAEPPPEPPYGPTKPEDWRKRHSAEFIRKLIESSNMPEDQKEICIRSLSSDFQGKYKELLAEYFLTMAEDQGVKK